MNLALNAEVITSKTTDLLLAKAYSQMLALASEAAAKNADAVDEELSNKPVSYTHLDVYKRQPLD